MLAKLPTRIILTSGIGRGTTKLNAFDNALLNAGIGNFNLSKISSIIPPNAKIIYLTKDNQEELLPKIGSIVPIVYSCICGERAGRYAAVLAIGIPKNYKKHNGLIFEFAGKNITKEKAQKHSERMLQEAFKSRNLQMGEVKFVGIDFVVKKEIICGIAAALLI